MGKKIRISTTRDGEKSSLGSLGQLFGGVDLTPSDNEGEVEPVLQPIVEAQPEEIDFANVRIRKEKKGRRGKTVTLVSSINASCQALEGLVSKWRKAFGCGGSLEDGTVVLQGDKVGVVEKWLGKNG